MAEHGSHGGEHDNIAHEAVHAVTQEGGTFSVEGLARGMVEGENAPAGIAVGFTTEAAQKVIPGITGLEGGEAPH